MTDFHDPTSHADHDPLLVAAHAAGDLDGRIREDANHLVATCAECATLLADLRAVAAATQSLPPPVRSRDFRLSEQDAARLRRRSWRTLLAPLAGPRFAVARPLGAAFTTLGLAGLMLAALPGALTFGGAATLPGSSETPSAAHAPAPTSLMEPMYGEAEIQDDRNGTGAPAAPGPAAGRGGEGQQDTAADDGGTIDPPPAGPDAEALAQRSADATLAILSGSFLIAGMGIFGLRWAARRLGDG